MSNGREAQVIDTFLALTDTLVGDFDSLDMLTMLAERSVELLDVTAAGVILTDGNGADSALSWPPPPPSAPACSRCSRWPSIRARAWTVCVPASRSPVMT